MSFITRAKHWLKALWHGRLPGLDPARQQYYRIAIVLTGAALVLTTVSIASISPEQIPAINQAHGMIAQPPSQMLATTNNSNGSIISKQETGPVQTLEASARHGTLDGNSLQWIKVTVRRGDTLSAILQRQNVDQPALRRAISQNRKARSLYRLSPGQIINLGVNNGGELQKLTYHMNSFETLNIRRDDNDVFSVNTNKREFETRIAYVTGIINHSLFVDGQAAGLSDPMIMLLVELFGWDIDFVLDIRKGDSFAVIFEEKFFQGQKVADGQVVAAEFVNRGKTYRVVAHKNSYGMTSYFSPTGHSIKRTFLRAPVKLSRITSRFTLRRYHPVLKRWRAHRGVDYGAPRGTPIRSTAKGRVTHAGRKGGYGNAVIIKHGGVYSTLYAHMTRLNRAIRVGSYVDQGQIIGFVGSTGLATGPHLHYEFRVNKAHRNPLTYHFPQAAPIKAKYRDDFLQQSQQWVAKLNTISRNSLHLARNN
ncbi:MAG TPA: peptidase M23 [Acidiferrobacteraceae bacterium]|nr:peptidase M23 [Acidiferrobacteraceae bacterium]HEX19466.1 peptidase M23 [Acidiferrobacteraceae bacterium]